MRTIALMLLVLWIALVAVCAERAFAKTPTNLKASVAEFMNEPASAAGEQEARAKYQALKKQAPNDRRLDYALGVYLIQRHKYAEGATLVERWTASGQAEPHAYCAAIDARLHARDYVEALAAAVALAKRFPDQRDHARDAEFYEAAEFLGTVFGYLEMNPPKLLDAALRNSHKTRVLELLGPAYATAFDAGRAMVAQQFAELQKTRDKVRHDAETETETTRRTTQAELDKSETALSGSEQSIQSSAENIDKASRELATIETQLQTLGQDRVRLEVQLATAQAYLQQVQLPSSRTIDLRDNSGRPTTSSSRQVASPERIQQAMSWSMTVASLNRQLILIDRQIVPLQARARQLTAAAQQQAQNLENAQSRAADTEKKSRSLERQLERAQPRVPPQVNRLAEKMSQFSTYAPFPFAQEQKRVLRWFDKP